MGKLEDLYTAVPGFSCVKGCTDCCGPVVWSRTEIERLTFAEQATLAQYMHGVGTAPLDCLSCPFSEAGSCAVYERRPLLCRLFGTIEDDFRMTCPHGRGPVRKLSMAEADALMQRYMSEHDILEALPRAVLARL